MTDWSAMDSALDETIKIWKNEKNMDMIDEEFSTSYKAARRCIELQKSKLIKTAEIRTMDSKI